jgi:glycine cleavage system regulatory protein
VVLTAVGRDHPGLVHGLSAMIHEVGANIEDSRMAILADRGVNVASLESRLTYAPFSATPMFVLDASLQVPSKLALSELRHQLAAACDEENLDFHLEPGT